MKKIISLVVAAMLMVAMVPSATNAATVDQWDGTADTSWYTANPSAATFTLTTAEQLAGLSQIVNGTGQDQSNNSIATDTFEGQTIKLANDLNLAGFEWTPIGGFYTGSYKPFLGIFDGRNHLIINMEIHRPTDDNDDYLGLFGVAHDDISKGATLKNISVLNVVVKGDVVLGGLVGDLSYGSITNCHTSGILEGRGSLGGLVGDAIAGTITRSSSSVHVTCTTTSITSAEIGGLVGVAFNAEISNSYATGNVVGHQANVGGLVGSAGGNSGQITNSYATGTVTTSSNENLEGIGGLVGFISVLNITTNSYGNSDVAEVPPRGTNGSEYVTGTRGASLTQMRTAEFAAKLGSAFAHDPSINGGFPYLVGSPLNSGPEPAPEPAPEPSPGPAPVPNTGDNTNMALYTTLGLIAIAGIGVITFRKRTTS